MLSKTLSVAMFILLAWLSIDHAKVKGMNIQTNNQLALMQQQISMLQQTIFDNKTLLEQQVSQQKVLATLFSENNSSSKAKDKKNPMAQKKKAVPKQKKVADILKDLNTRLAKITKHQTKKELAPASKLITELKTEVWKIRKHKEIKKDLALSVVSLIDIALKKWKAKDVSYTTEKITAKIKLLSIHSKPPAKKKAVKEKNKPTLSNKKSDSSKNKDEDHKNSSDIIKKLNTRLTTINEHQAKKDLKTASSLLKEFKGVIWKIRNNKGIKKDVALSMMSSIDSTMKKWDAKDDSYTTKNIAEKMKRLSLKKEASK